MVSMTLQRRMITAAVLVVGVAGTACGSGKSEEAPSISTSPSSSPTLANSGYEPFTPQIDPCSLIRSEELVRQGLAPLTGTAEQDNSGMQTCRYQDVAHSFVATVTLFNHRGLADSYRDLKLRTIESEGVTVLVLTDEAAKCGADLVDSASVVQFDFEPTAEAVAAAALPPTQTWCDLSAPTIVEAGKRLGWAKPK
ncbi:hypothetical protein DE4587_04218 [Mycobacteroides salmoniphilum]|nr:hypothetical protein DE4586_04680 [Mycobacteroides salmoniphilum]TDZ85291.1 hypothetical protein DE4587_04218 [Mycobacteroides salmoniphilum]